MTTRATKGERGDRRRLGRLRVVKTLPAEERSERLEVRITPTEHEAYRDAARRSGDSDVSSRARRALFNAYVKGRR